MKGGEMKLWGKGRSLAQQLDRSPWQLDNLAELTHQMLEGCFPQ